MSVNYNNLSISEVKNIYMAKHTEHSNLYNEYKEKANDLICSNMKYAEIICFSNSNVQIGFYKNEYKYEFDIYFDHKNFFDENSGYEMKINTSCFGSFNVFNSDESEKYIKYFNNVSEFLSNEKLKQEFFDLMTEYNDKNNRLMNEIYECEAVIKKYEAELRVNEETEKRNQRIEILKKNFADAGTNKYIVLEETSDYSCDTIYRKKNYRSLFEKPMSLEEICENLGYRKYRNMKNYRLKMVESDKVKFGFFEQSDK